MNIDDFELILKDPAAGPIRPGPQLGDKAYLLESRLNLVARKYGLAASTSWRPRSARATTRACWSTSPRR